MKTKRFSRPVLSIAAVIAVAALALTGCTSTGGTSHSKTPTPSDSDAALIAMLPSTIQQSKVINVATPYGTSVVSVEADGVTVTGTVPDLAAAIAPILGVTFKWANAPFPALIPGLQSGKYDIVWANLTDSVERQKVISFVNFSQSLSQLLVLKDNPNHITDVDDSLCGLRAASLTGSVELQNLQDQSAKCTAAGKKAIDVTSYDSAPNVLLALRSGRTDAMFATASLIVFTLKAGGQNDLFTAVGKLSNPALLGIGVAKDSGQLAEALQGALKKVVKNGTYDKIFKSYGYENLELTADQIAINGAKS